MRKVSLKEHLEMQIRHQCELREADDRRYTEVQIERARALAYKEKGDQTALELARTHQHYLDEKANQLREQINSERGNFVNQEQFKPVADFVVSQQGGSKVWNAVVAIAMTVAGFVIAWLLRGGGS